MKNYDIESELIPHLLAGEKLVWTGRPKTGVRFRPTDAFIIPFSLVWCGFVVFWEATAIAMGAPLLFMLFGIPFVLVGLYMLIGRFFFDAKRRAKTVYGISNNRIIIKSGVVRTQVESMNIKSISEISFTQKQDLSGTITLGPVASGYSTMQIKGMQKGPQPTSLEWIDDVKTVYEKIIELQQKRLKEVEAQDGLM